MELITVSVILIVVGALIASYLVNGVVALVLFTIFFVFAGLFSGVSFLLWLADTPSRDERLLPVLCSIFFTTLCVGTVLLGG